VTFNAGGDRGSYLIAVPPAAKPPLPVVFDLHGYLESASEQETITGLSQFGITHGFITVTPQVTETVPHWNFAPGSSDLAFLGALVDHIEASQCVNTVLERCIHDLVPGVPLRGPHCRNRHYRRHSGAGALPCESPGPGHRLPRNCGSLCSVQRRRGTGRRLVARSEWHGHARVAHPYSRRSGSLAIHSPDPDRTGSLGRPQWLFFTSAPVDGKVSP
jgi:hypothetical protein